MSKMTLKIFDLSESRKSLGKISFERSGLALKHEIEVSSQSLQEAERIMDIIISNAGKDSNLIGYETKDIKPFFKKDGKIYLVAGKGSGEERAREAAEEITGKISGENVSSVCLFIRGGITVSLAEASTIGETLSEGLKIPSDRINFFLITDETQGDALEILALILKKL